MTLDDAIKHCQQVADESDCECANEHKQLVEWLKELKKFKQKQTNEEYIRTASVNDVARLIATKLCELARHEYGIYDVVDYANVFEWLKEKHDGNT